ncbi:MAG: YqeG family HAD IIIA-type phosphatase, partial [Ruminococcaceae bacterium]|nr:YqeG family HAD IIIA-type phosphatase [Oscillospiraceae bacterium]
MPLCLLPDVVTESLEDLTAEDLRKRNIKLLMMDFDNTIVPYITNTPTPAVDAWL